MSNVVAVLGGGFVSLLGLGGTGLWMLSGHKRSQAWVRRRQETLGPYLKPKAGSGLPLLTAVRSRQHAGNRHLLEKTFNWRESRRNQYPISLKTTVLCMMLPSYVAALLASKVAGPLGWFLLPIINIAVTRLFLGWAAARVSRTLLVQFPEVLAMISRSVRVGVPLGEAVRLVARESQAPTREEFRRAGDQVAIGLDLEHALLEMADRNEIAEYRFFATALALQSQTGGGLTETLETLADTIRKRESARKRGYALASEARTSIYVLAALPIVVGMMLFVMNPDYVGVLFTDPTGEKLLGIASFMLIFGLVVMQQIIKNSLT